MLTLSLLWKKFKLNIQDIIYPKTYKSALTWFVISMTLTLAFLVYVEMNFSFLQISFWLLIGILFVAWALFSWVGNCFKVLNTPTLVPL